MQILHPFQGSVQAYLAQLSDPAAFRPTRCPQCDHRQPLIAHGFYERTIASAEFDGPIEIRRYLCEHCKRTTSLLPEFALPYIRSAISVIAAFLVARLLLGKTLRQASGTASHQRGQHWIRRFRGHAERLTKSLAGLVAPPPAPSPVHRALLMLGDAPWIPAPRFLFGELRDHLLRWPPSLAPGGVRRAHPPPVSSAMA